MIRISSLRYQSTNKLRDIADDLERIIKGCREIGLTPRSRIVSLFNAVAKELELRGVQQ